MLISALLGIAIGTIMGLTGAGGGIFAVPALVMVLGIEQSSAGSIALLAVGAAAALGAFQGLRQGIVRYKAALLLATVGSASAPLGLYFSKLLSPQWLSLIFAAIMLLGKEPTMPLKIIKGRASLGFIPFGKIGPLQ